MRALLAVYSFPPSGGPGVQRGVKLCRYLPEAGVEPTVITVESDAYLRRRGVGVLDPAMAEELPPGLRVIRTRTGDNQRLRSRLRKLHLLDLAWHVAPRTFFEAWAGWYRPLLRAAREEIRRARPDVLLTSSPPHVVHLVGLKLRRRHGIPWVADFRDPWHPYWWKPWPSRRAMLWESRREADVIAGADAVIANTPGHRRELIERYPRISSEKIVSIANGYDPEDFAVPPATRSADEVLVVHVGRITCDPPRPTRHSPKAGVGGENVFDRSTQSFEWLLQAIATLRTRPGAPRVRARLVGTVDEAWTARAEELGVRDQVEFTGYLPHREAVTHMLAADVLYLPTITRKDGRPQTQVPAKTYEYLGSGRPVVALTDESDVRELLTERPRCTLLSSRDSAGLADLLARLTPGRPPHALPPDPPDAWPWRRDELARRMAEVLRRVAGG